MTEALIEPDEVDRMEADILKLPPIDLPLVHSFTPGAYVRQIFMPAGARLTSMTHKTRHHFVILTGEIAVISGTEKIIYKGPHVGITEAGTKRVLMALKDTVWLTFHPNPDDVTDPDELVEQITEPNDNPLFKGMEDHPRINVWKKDVSPSLTVDRTEKLIS